MQRLKQVQHVHYTDVFVVSLTRGCILRTIESESAQSAPDRLSTSGRSTTLRAPKKLALGKKATRIFRNRFACVAKQYMHTVLTLCRRGLIEVSSADCCAEFDSIVVAKSLTSIALFVRCSAGTTCARYVHLVHQHDLLLLLLLQVNIR
jgi:hypothetical protein